MTWLSARCSNSRLLLPAGAGCGFGYVVTLFSGQLVRSRLTAFETASSPTGRGLEPVVLFVARRDVYDELSQLIWITRAFWRHWGQYRTPI